MEIRKREMRATHSSSRSGRTRTSIVFLLFFVTNLSLPTVSESSHQCKAWLVQSIPTDMPHLPRVPGVLSTGKSVFCLFSEKLKENNKNPIDF